MKNYFHKVAAILIGTLLAATFNTTLSQPAEQFYFDGNINNILNTSIKGIAEGDVVFGNGLEGKSLKFCPNRNKGIVSIKSEGKKFNNQKYFSIQFWIKTDLADDKKGSNSVSKEKCK